ncbi:MAG: outer membrane protein assembly factor BamA [Candidatus Aerophobus sp.]|nr:MAG: outer membrane protein assembly factor BamA [Candidatus Aerophobus sp.]
MKNAECPLDGQKEGVFVRKVGKILILAVLLAIFFLSGSMAQVSPIIREIQIQGAKHIKTEKIKEVIKSRVGEPLSEEIVREDMQAIYEMGFFSSLKTLKEEVTDGVRLIFQVKENEEIVKIEIKGVSKREKNKIKRLITFKEGQLWNFKKIKETRDKILAFYDKRGYFSTSVDLFSIGLEKGKCKAVLTIKKDRRTRVREVRVEGNTFFSDRKIKRSMKTRFRGFFDPKILNEDLERVIDLYQNSGYYFAYFESPRLEFFTEGRTHWVRVFLEIVEGKKFFVSEVEIKGNHVFPTSKILSQLRPGKGKIFVLTYLEKSLDLLRDKYGGKGYIYAHLEPDLEFDRQAGEVKILLQIEEGSLAKVGKIKIEGNTFTKERVFRHTFVLKEGDILNAHKLREGWRRLYNLGFFETVEIEPLFTSSSTVDLLVKVKEAEQRGQILFGAGYSSVSGLEGHIQLSKDNLGGVGKKIKLDWKFGKKRSDYDIGYIDRWWRDSPLRLELDLYNLLRKYYEAEGAYQKERIGGKIGLGWPIWKNMQTLIRLRNEKVTISHIEGEPFPEDPELEAGSKIERSLELMLNRNTRVRDEAFNTYKGSYSFLSVEKTGGFLGGDLEFTKYKAEWRGYLRKGEFWKSPILAYRLGGRLGEDLPFYEQFYLGGLETLRGYEENEFRGDKVVLGSLELRVPLAKELLGSLFVDAGKAWSEDSPMEDFKVGWGFGIRFKTPIGLIRLNYGVGEKEGRFYFGMGEAF